MADIPPDNKRLHPSDMRSHAGRLRPRLGRQSRVGLMIESRVGSAVRRLVSAGGFQMGSESGQVGSW